MHRIVVLGRIGYDLYSEEQHVPLERVRRFRCGLGGSSANIAVGLARLGCEVRMVAATSDDAIGRFLLSALADEHVDTSLVQFVQGHNTSLCLTEVSPPLRFEQVFYRAHPVDAQLAWNDSIGRAVSECSTFVTNGTSLCAQPSRDATLRALRGARESGAAAVFDVDYRASSWGSAEEAGAAARAAWPWIDVLIANADEIRLLANPDSQRASELEIAGEALENGVKLVIWKQGEQGATALAPGRQVHVPAFPVTVTSTIGAGDGFAAGFAYAQAEGQPLDQSLLYGNACAACVVQQVGCSEAMPTLPELRRFLSENSPTAAKR
ncbi:MAG: 5-dehydro-2-deoxygluconokinase [Terriglobia bacterium]